MEHDDTTIVVAGIDVGKFRLDAALAGRSDGLSTGNDEAGIARLASWLQARGVGRVGIEATGGYERAVRAALEARQIEVVVHQPIEVRLYGRLTRTHAKTDPIDARLIAAATAALARRSRRIDPALLELAERLTAYEQVAQLLMTLRTFRTSLHIDSLKHMLDEQIAQLSRLKREMVRHIVAAITANAPLAARYKLLISLPGIGPIVAASLVVRMPELGSMQRGQAASLIGVAPHARDSGTHKGLRFIAGGRSRPRRMLYLAALSAARYDPCFSAFAKRLKANGKPAKIAIVAVMRKLIEAANLVLKRNSPWAKIQA